MYTLTGRNQALNLDLAARITRVTDRQLFWDFDFDARSPSSHVIGGGISFTFDLADFRTELGDPELLPGNLGWAWGHLGGNRIELRFDHPMAAVYFERGQKSELRAFFYKDDVPQGRRHYVATLSVSGDMSLGPTALEKFGQDDYTAWPSGIMGSDSSPVDLSFLNAGEKPAGKRGFLKARGEDLVFDDGTPVRFWGTNLTSYALFSTPKADVRKQAHRLSQLGFNLVRLHHHDSEWVNPNIFGDQSAPGTQTLSEEMLERLDWWIACLKDEGVYVWLDLNVGRRLKPADGIQDFDEIRQGKASASLDGFNYVNDSIRAAMKRFDDSYLNHQNHYTAVRYKDEPAIVTVLLSNENDLTHHYGNALLPDKGVPRQSAIFMREAERFAAKYSLPKDRVWRAWEAGPSKIFLNDLEERFDGDMIAHLRGLGVRAPIVTTSTWGMNPLSSLPALTAGDIIDAHSYGGVGELDKNPLSGSNFVHWIAAARVAGKPLTATEWGVDDHGSLSPDRQDIPLYLAAAASMQGWNAVMFYAYSQEPLTVDHATPSIYHAYDDPALMAAFPAAALLYRERHVKEASTRYVFAPNAAALFDQDLSAASSVALRTAAERGRLAIALPQVPELPWLGKSVIPAGAVVLTDPQKSLIPAGASQIVSDTGELTRNWDRGTFTVNTARSQSAMGWIGGTTITLPDVDIMVTTRNAVVAVQSLDQNPITRSRNILISAAARSTPASEHTLPFYSEPVEGRLMISALPGLSLAGWDARISKMRRLPFSFKAGRYTVKLDGNLRTSWLMLTDAARTPAAPTEYNLRVH